MMNPWFLFAFVILLQAVENEGCSPTWPRGRYTLLKPRTGCPDGWDDEGYLYQDTIDKNPSNNRSETLHIDGEVANSYVKRFFCSKTCTGKKHKKQNQSWPSGQYCVYRHENEKLPGMTAGSILMYGKKHKNDDKRTFTKFRVDIKKLRGSYQYMRLYFTCRTRGNKKIPIALPITKPFYLLPYGSRDCQQVKWMVATSEWIKYHTNNHITKRGKQTNGTVPYHELGDRNHKGITMFYCYYESCKYTLNDTKGVFQSPGFPDKYPDGQKCSWRIVVPDNHTLQVHFSNFSLDGNDKLRYAKIINGSFKLWYRIPVSKVPFTLSPGADFDVLFDFRSDESNTSSGFRAEYRVFIPPGTTTPTEKPVDTTPSTAAPTPSSMGKPFTAEPRSSTLIMSKKTSTPEPPFQDNKSNAEAIKDSPFCSSRNKAIAVIAIPAFCLLIGVVLLMIIYQYMQDQNNKKSCHCYPKRETEAADRSVMNPTYGRGAILLNPTN